MTRVVGLDPSLSSSGVCHIPTPKIGAMVLDEPLTFAIETKPGKVGSKAAKSMDRARRISEQRRVLAEFIRPGDQVFIESLVARSHSATILGGIGWALRCAVVDAGAVFYELPPATIKMFATGVGNADKEVVAAAVARASASVFETDDECDAFVAWCVGRELFGLPHPLRDVAARNHRALDRIDFKPMEPISVGGWD